MRKTISIDFDGVIHIGDDNWIAPGIVAGRLNPDALSFIQGALEAGWDVVIHSCRFYDLGAAVAVRTWLYSEIVDSHSHFTAEYIIPRLQYSLTKPRARIYIDDRGFRYEGQFPRLEDIA